MALPVWKCTDCEKEFRAGNWDCASGAGHRVEVKRYYMNDAPTVPALVNGQLVVNKRDSATLVMNIPPEERVKDAGGVERVIPGGAVQFIRGMYSTDNPREQFWLDKKKGIFSGDEGQKIWEAAYLNDQEKFEIERMQFEAARTRLENERNSLLEQVQKRA